MVDSFASEPLSISSHAGPYEVRFIPDAFERLDASVQSGTHVIIDANVARLYREVLGHVLGSDSVLVVEASELAKSLDRFPGYVEHLVERAIRRHHRLLAIGGGVIQDITCFLAATILRGVEWEFYPTTLLAQADSCIGSKSSINVGSAKNILGTFTPPKRIAIATPVLATLSMPEWRSGVGEMLKVHAITGPSEFDAIAHDYDLLFSNDAVLQHYIRRSLEFKRRLIELDEFDRGPRNVMNYGHTFGHAIESATRFAVPHGIAVTIGMDMANYVAAALGGGDETFRRMHHVLQNNYAGYKQTGIPFDGFLEAIGKDKKNSDREISLILPNGDGVIRPVRRANDDAFRGACREYLTSVLAQ